MAPRKTSTSTRLAISRQCNGPCSTKRCKSYEEGKKCSVHCHRDENDCGNISGLVARTEVALEDRPRRKRAWVIGSRSFSIFLLFVSGTSGSSHVHSPVGYHIREWGIFVDGVYSWMGRSKYKRIEAHFKTIFNIQPLQN